jgi:hypothetical protein
MSGIPFLRDVPITVKMPPPGMMMESDKRS